MSTVPYNSSFVDSGSISFRLPIPGGRSSRDADIPAVSNPDLARTIRVLRDSERSKVELTSGHANFGAVGDWFQSLAEKYIIHKFATNPSTVRHFRRLYNGSDILRYVARLLAGAQIDDKSAAGLISEIFEDALIATASHFLDVEARHVRIGAERLPVLRNALVKRFPRISTEQAVELVEVLLEELRASLGNTFALAIDGGAVWLRDDDIVVTVLPNDPIGPRELYLLADRHINSEMTV